MISIICFFIISFSLIFLLWRINRIPSRGIILLLKFFLFLVLGGQFWAIFQNGVKTAGVPTRIPFFENFIVTYLHLPNLEVQWASFVFCIATVILCLPKVR